MADEKLNDTAPDTAPPADAPPADASADTAPTDEAEHPLDEAVATEAEGKPVEAEEASPPPDSAATPGDAPGGPSEVPGEASEGAPADPTPASEPEAEAKPEAEAAPKGPSFGEVKDEVADVGDHLPADTLDALREAGCGLFLFMADMSEVDTSALGQEAKARLANVRDRAQLLLAAIESVFVRHG